jgi:hypothetical protein
MLSVYTYGSVLFRRNMFYSKIYVHIWSFMNHLDMYKKQRNIMNLKPLMLKANMDAQIQHVPPEGNRKRWLKAAAFMMKWKTTKIEELYCRPLSIRWYLTYVCTCAISNSRQLFNRLYEVLLQSISFSLRFSPFLVWLLSYHNKTLQWKNLFYCLTTV